jgi:DNA-binding FadR family transcriptional regulator
VAPLEIGKASKTAKRRSTTKDAAPLPDVPAVKPLKRKDEDLQRIHQYLAGSGLKPQGRIPPERELGDVLGLSRARLRSALRKLVAEGVIWRHVGKGTFLGQAPADGALQAAGPLLIDFTNPREIMEARLAFEPQLARLAAIRATRQDFNEMDTCVEKLRTTPSGPVWEIWDVRLHRTIAKSIENKIMLGMFDLMYARWDKEVWGDLRAIYHTADRMAEGNAEHTSFVEAIKARDPDAAYSAMRQHLQSVQRTIFREG